MSRIPSSRIYGLVLCLVLAWGLSWPVGKIGLQYMPPSWYAAYRLLIGMFSLFLIVAVTGKLVIPHKRDLPIIFVMGLIQMAVFILLITTGLHYVDPGRSAMLVYTTPLWVIPLAILIFNEKLTMYKALGFMLGIAGIIVLFSPWGLDWSDHEALFGNGLLLLAALTWAIGILCARNMTWHRSTLELVPWQMLIGLIPVFLLAYFLHPLELIHWNGTLVGSLLFTGIFGTAFGFWGSMVVSKELPSITVSLCFLAIPVAGIAFSALLIHEPITYIMMVAMVFILAGLALVAWGAKSSRRD